MSKAREIAEERLAKGEIDSDEFTKIVSNLSETKDESLSPSNQSEPSSRNVQLEIEDGFVNLDGYDGVRTKTEFVTQLNGGAGLLFLISGFFLTNNRLLLIGLVMLAIAVLSLVFSRAVKLQVLKNGTWDNLGKFTYQEAEKKKETIIASIKNK